MMYRLQRYACSMLCCVLLSTTLVAQASPRTAARYLRRLQKQAARLRAVPTDLQVVTDYFVDGTLCLLTDHPMAAWHSLQKALKLDPLNAAIHHKLGQLLQQYPHLEAKSKYKATTHMHVATALAPHNKAYYVAAAYAYLQQEQCAAAIQVYEQMMQHLPADDGTLMYLAALYTQQQNHRQAIRLYNQLEQRQGITPDIIAQKQYNYLQMRRPSEAIAEGMKLADAYPHVETHVTHLADLLQEHERPTQAIDYLTAVLDSHPTHAQVRLRLAHLLLDQHYWASALPHVQQSLADAQLTLESKLALVHSYMRYSAPETRADCQQVAATLYKAYPRNVQVLRLCGDLCHQLGEATHALKYYHHALAHSEPCRTLWQSIMAIYTAQHMPQHLCEAVHKALAQFPDHALFYYYHGIALLMQQQYTQAAEVLLWGRSLASSSDELACINTELGNAYNLLQQYRQADTYYQAVLDSDPDNDVVLNNYSYSLALRKQHLALARSMSRKLVKAYPGHAAYLDTYAWVLYQSGYYRQAKAYLEEALAAAPTTHSGTIREHYGDTLYQLGEVQAALTQWAEAQGQPGASDALPQKLEIQQLIP